MKYRERIPVMRKFVMMEVEEIHTSKKEPDGKVRYRPVGHDGDGNFLNLDPSLVIDVDRLGYTRPKEGDTFFEPHSGSGWIKATRDFSSNQVLCLLPVEDERTEREKWIDDCPACDPAIKKWLKEMPNEKT